MQIVQTTQATAVALAIALGAALTLAHTAATAQATDKENPMLGFLRQPNLRGCAIVGRTIINQVADPTSNSHARNIAKATAGPGSVFVDVRAALPST